MSESSAQEERVFDVRDPNLLALEDHADYVKAECVARFLESGHPHFSRAGELALLSPADGAEGPAEGIGLSGFDFDECDRPAGAVGLAPGCDQVYVPVAAPKAALGDLPAVDVEPPLGHLLATDSHLLPCGGHGRMIAGRSVGAPSFAATDRYFGAIVYSGRRGRNFTHTEIPMRKAFLALLLVAASACGLTGPDKVTVNVVGRVTAAATGQPIVGARMVLADPALDHTRYKTLATTTTDGQGRYSLSASVDEDCDIGFLIGLHVEVHASGFQSGFQDLTECEGSFVFDFALDAQ